MSEKRRDNRNRILHNGETQLADGRYRFRYSDLDGKRRDVYSWRLDHNDRMPKNKPHDLSLREKEKQIKQNLFNQVASNGGNMTVLELSEKYTSLKCGVRDTTRTGYKTVLNVLKKDPFGKKRIDKVKISDAKGWLIKLQQVDGRGYSSIHQLQYINGKGKKIQEPKTDSGVRFVPMTKEVAECFRKILMKREKPAIEKMIDGYSGFIFLDEYGNPTPAYYWEKRMQRICKKYNSIYKVQMPKVTPHVCRHTFCSNMAKSGMNPKTLQYIMGHADIRVTLNTYTHVNFEDAKQELDRVSNC